MYTPTSLQTTHGPRISACVLLSSRQKLYPAQQASWTRRLRIFQNSSMTITPTLVLQWLAFLRLPLVSFWVRVNPSISPLCSIFDDFLLVWTRLENSSFVNTAPVDAAGNIPVSPDDVVMNLLKSRIMWAYFKPGFGWILKGNLTSSTSGTFAAAARLSDTRYNFFSNSAAFLLSKSDLRPFQRGAPHESTRFARVRGNYCRCRRRRPRLR